MRSHTIKWILLISTGLIALIIVMQLFWLNKVYRLEQKEFNNNVVKSIRGLLEDIDLADTPATQLHQLIEHPDAHTFLIKIDSIPSKDTLVYFLSNEFEDFEVMANCIMAVYDNQKKQFVYQVYMPSAASSHMANTRINIPVIQKDYPYICLFFPHREQYILQQLGLWIAASLLLLAALIAFAVSLFYLYKQKTLNEVQKDFVNNFTHEFKTPLAVMKLAADVLANPFIVEQPERLKKYGNIIQQQTAHLQNQVDRLLRTASSEAHFLPLEMKTVVVNNLVQEVLQELEPLIQQKNARIQFKPDENNTAVQADEAHLAMVMVNLIENAIKYAADPVVIISTYAENGHCIISVKDNGVGIEQKYLPYLFNKFYRVPTGDVHNVKGFGLGLNFVKKVVDGHRAKITVNSLPGIGTEFKIYLSRV